MRVFPPASKSRIVVMTAVGALVTILFSFLGAPILRVVRGVGGKTLYWISGAIICGLMQMGGLGLMAPLVVGTWVCLGVYAEFEDRGRADVWAAFWSVFLGTVFCGLSFGLTVQTTGIDPSEILKQSFEPIFAQLPKENQAVSLLTGLQLDLQHFVNQLPSMAAVLVMSSLAFALILDRKMAVLTRLRFERAATGIRLLEFRIPDVFVWVVLLSFLFSFLKTGIPWQAIVALNIFNVMMAAYFFQGLAVLETAFLVFRVGTWTKALIYIFIVGQLFFLVSLVGLIDYWVDFRRRFRGIPSAEGDTKNGEQI